MAQACTKCLGPKKVILMHLREATEMGLQICVKTMLEIQSCRYDRQLSRKNLSSLNFLIQSLLL